MRSHDRRALDRDCERMLRALSAGDLPSFEASLEARSDPEVLVRLRERKALSKVPEAQRRTVAGMLLAAAARLLDSRERESFGRYVAFAIAYAEAEQGFRRSVRDILVRLPPLSLPDLLAAAQTTFQQAGPDGGGRACRTIAAIGRHGRA